MFYIFSVLLLKDRYKVDQTVFEIYVTVFSF